jgi:gluconolactonase
VPALPASIPDPYLDLDERFGRCHGDTRLEVLFEGCRWGEGAVYVPAGRYLLFSDIPNDRLLRWDECTGTVGVFRTPAGHPNGNTLDREGRLLTCEHSGRRVSRTEHDGSVTVLADRFEGKRLNSPNDVVVKSDGSVWFTDPSYGIASDYEGARGESEIGACNVYRVDPDDGAVVAVAEDFELPNGLAFCADESRLFIADTGVNQIRVFDVSATGELSGGGEFASCTNGVFDGFRLDGDGRLWAAAGDGVHCFDADGTLIGKIRVPETVSNVAFGGLRRNRLFICGATALYSIHLPVNGLARLSAPRG